MTAQIVDEGKVGQWHCYRVVLRGMKSLDAMTARNEVACELMNRLHGVWKIGADFDTQPAIPAMPFNPDRKDCFVLIWSFSDKLLFDDIFDPLTKMTSDVSVAQ
jgi:hypothetical protein